jgi:hypothetical protein
MAACVEMLGNDVITLLGPPPDLATCRARMQSGAYHLADRRRGIPALPDDASDADGAASGVSSPRPPIRSGPLQRSRGSFSSVQSARSTASARSARRGSPYARPPSQASRAGSTTSDDSGVARLSELDPCDGLEDTQHYRLHPGPRIRHVTAMNC